MEMKAGLTFACMNLKKLAAYSQTALAKSEELAKQAKFVELCHLQAVPGDLFKKIEFLITSVMFSQTHIPIFHVRTDTEKSRS